MVFLNKGTIAIIIYSWFIFQKRISVEEAAYSQNMRESLAYGAFAKFSIFPRVER